MRRPPLYTRRNREQMLYRFKLLCELRDAADAYPHLLPEQLRMHFVMALSDARSDIKGELSKFPDFLSITVDEFEAALKQVNVNEFWKLDHKTTDQQRDTDTTQHEPCNVIHKFTREFVDNPLNYQIQRVKSGNIYG